MVIAATMVSYNTCVTSGIAFVGLAASLQNTTFGFDLKHYSVTQPSLFRKLKRMGWSIRSSTDDNGFNRSSSNGTDGRTRLIRVIQAFQARLGAKIQEVRKYQPVKLFFFSWPDSTVQLPFPPSAALAVVVVEGIGALMYKASIPLLSKVKSLITMFNYWKAGLSLGLFLDSF
ncbi:Ycf20-like protein [Quillaja saponaria]|uniref:Ycf20-like protein n=1 Tax=Quillaja saponaria TaxID=32244 RepID=A0AAD7PPD2_QUISA|nr:Ycf20-like protein [Quillaja saponaria]